MQEDKIIIYTDGASRGNPGHSAIAYIIVKDGKVVCKEGLYIGIATNNVAEYTAIIKALEKMHTITSGPVEVISDSQLVIRQLRGEWRVKKQHLSVLHRDVKRLCDHFSFVTFTNVSRNTPFIQMADTLANYALDIRD
ncbi:MAG: ribonuclease HI family protein [Candidatus Methanofastidiosia archaeon]